MARSGTKQNRYTRNAPAEQNIELEESLRAMLVNVMKEQYPDIQAYKDGQILNDPPPGEDPPEEMTINQAANYEGSVLVDSNASGEDIKYSVYTMQSLEPDATDEELEELIDDTFSEFVEEPIPETAGGAVDLVNDIFIASGDISLHDVHAAYLESGPQTIGENTNPDDVFCVFYVKNNIARPIPNYQTLEVMLVESNQTYNDIQEATDADRAKYDLNFDGTNPNITISGTPNDEFQARKLADMSGEWGLRIRFDSGYKPKAPFVRDPADYYNTSTEDDTNPYISTVYKKQTADEKLREQFEGKCVVLQAGQDEDGNINYAQEDTLRMLINGYWKGIYDTDVLRYYNTYRELGATIDDDLEQSIINLIDKGGCTILNEDGNGSPIWNAFPHINQINYLDPDEYNDYWENANAGEPFALDYMQPFEPAGSIKYYSAGTTVAMQAEAINELASIEDDVQAQWSLNAAVTNLTSDFENLISQYETTVASISTQETDISDPVTAKITEIRNDLFSIFIGAGDTGNKSWRITKKGQNQYSDRNFFVVCKQLGANSAKYNLLLDAYSTYVAGFTSRGPKGIILDQKWVYENGPEFDYQDAADGFDFDLPRSTNENSRGGSKTYQAEADAYWRGCISKYYDIDLPWGDADGVATNRVGSESVGPGWLQLANRLSGTGESYQDFALTAFDTELEQLGIEGNDAHEELKDQLTDILEDIVTDYNNWKEIPAEAQENIDIPGFNYSVGDVQEYQEKYNGYLSQLGEYQEELQENSVVPPWDQIEEVGQKYIGQAYTVIEAWRQALWSGTQGQKWAILWPKIAKDIVDKYLPYGDAETSGDRYQKYIWNWDGSTLAGPTGRPDADDDAEETETSGGQLGRG